jgi:hypothetical protein
VVTSGLPDSCPAFDGWVLDRDDTRFIIGVYNARATGQMASAEVYGTVRSAISLGTGLAAGQEYRVPVNHRALTFQGQ